MEMYEDLVWGQDMAVGHAKIDEQHRLLIRLVNRFNHSLTSPDSVFQSEVRNTVASLALYTSLHFKMEEDLMFMSAYPGMADHIVGHDQIRIAIDTWIDAFDNDDVDLDLVANKLRSLMESAAHHKADVDLVTYLNTDSEFSSKNRNLTPPIWLSYAP